MNDVPLGDKAGAIGRQYHKKCYNQDSSGKRLDEWAYILVTVVPMVQMERIRLQTSNATVTE